MTTAIEGFEIDLLSLFFGASAANDPVYDFVA